MGFWRNIVKPPGANASSSLDFERFQEMDDCSGTDLSEMLASGTAGGIGTISPVTAANSPASKNVLDPA